MLCVVAKNISTFVTICGVLWQMNKLQRRSKVRKAIGLVQPVTRYSIPKIQGYDVVEYDTEIVSALKPVLNFVFASVVLVGLWLFAVEYFKPAPYLLPSPIDVAGALSSNFDRFVVHVGTTAYESISGFLIGNILGFLIAIPLYRYLSLQKFTLPVLISFQAIPIVALAPLLVVWLGTGFLSKIAMAAIICFFPMVIILCRHSRILTGILPNFSSSTKLIFFRDSVCS